MKMELPKLDDIDFAGIHPDDRAVIQQSLRRAALCHLKYLVGADFEGKEHIISFNQYFFQIHTVNEGGNEKWKQ